MASENQSEPQSAEEWKEALPKKIPGATFAPAFLALGITFLLFGIVSSYVFSAAGLVLMVWSISMWIGELVSGDES
jgi:membrane-bound ClpP family serine protease